MRGHKDAIYDFVLDQEARVIYSAGADGYIVEWQIDSPEDGRVVLTADEALYSVGMVDGSLKTGTRSGVIYSIDLIRKKLDEQKSTHKSGVFFINEHGSGGEDGIFYSHIQNALQISSKSLRCYVIGEKAIYVGCSDYAIYVLDKETLEVLQKLEGHTNSVIALELLDENTLVSTGRDAMIRAWDLTLGKEVHSVPAHDYQAKSLSWNGQILLSSSMDKTIKLWSDQLELWKVIDFDRYQGHTNCINKVEWIDSEHFVSCSDDRSLVLWKVEIKI